MSPSAIDTAKLPFYKVNNTKSPCEGPVAIPFVLDFSANTEYNINLQNSIDLKRISMVQAVFLDNSAGSDVFTCNNPITNQTISCPANSQGYFGVTCPNPATLVFSSASGVKLYAEILNYPVNTRVWKAV